VQHDGRGKYLTGPRAVAGAVERLGGLGVGVGVEKAIEGTKCVGVGLTGLPAAERDGNLEAGGRSTAEADVEVDLVVLENGDVFDEQSGDPFAFAHGSGGV
jgi:hypothetical protein